jgi:hypothetical protein
MNMNIEIILGIILLVMFGPPLLFLILGLARRKTDKEIAKLFYVLAAGWLIVGGGICASLVT